MNGVTSGTARALGVPTATLIANEMMPKIAQSGGIVPGSVQYIQIYRGLIDSYSVVAAYIIDAVFKSLQGTINIAPVAGLVSPTGPVTGTIANNPMKITIP